MTMFDRNYEEHLDNMVANHTADDAEAEAAYDEELAFEKAHSEWLYGSLELEEYEKELKREMKGRKRRIEEDEELPI